MDIKIPVLNTFLDVTDRRSRLPCRKSISMQEELPNRHQGVYSVSAVTIELAADWNPDSGMVPRGDDLSDNDAPSGASQRTPRAVPPLATRIGGGWATCISGRSFVPSTVARLQPTPLDCATPNHEKRVDGTWHWDTNYISSTKHGKDGVVVGVVEASSQTDGLRQWLPQENGYGAQTSFYASSSTGIGTAPTLMRSSCSSLSSLSISSNEIGANAFKTANSCETTTGNAAAAAGGSFPPEEAEGYRQTPVRVGSELAGGAAPMLGPCAGFGAPLRAATADLDPGRRGVAGRQYGTPRRTKSTQKPEAPKTAAWTARAAQKTSDVRIPALSGTAVPTAVEASYPAEGELGPMLAPAVAEEATPPRNALDSADMSPEILQMIPRDEAGELLSYGSINHARGECKACVFYHNPTNACTNGPRCLFCHYPHAPKKRVRMSKRKRLEIRMAGHQGAFAETRREPDRLAGAVELFYDARTEPSAGSAYPATLRPATAAPSYTPAARDDVNSEKQPADPSAGQAARRLPPPPGATSAHDGSLTDRWRGIPPPLEPLAAGGSVVGSSYSAAYWVPPVPHVWADGWARRFILNFIPESRLVETVGSKAVYPAGVSYVGTEVALKCGDMPQAAKDFLPGGKEMPFGGKDRRPAAYSSRAVEAEGCGGSVATNGAAA